MAKRLTDNINSQFFEAANRMTSKKARRKIVAYVESYDDVFFWRSVLGKFENEKRYFDIMLPTRNQHLDRGKKAAISSMLKGVGRDMIACVDADYDYLRQGSTESSQQMLENPFIFHTYAYAIENFQCYARGLHETCVMVTLNDRRIFDFERFLESYSRTIWPLFLWHMLFYVRHRKMSMHFDMAEFDKVIMLPSVRIQDPKWAIDYLGNIWGDLLCMSAQLSFALYLSLFEYPLCQAPGSCCQPVGYDGAEHILRSGGRSGKLAGCCQHHGSHWWQDDQSAEYRHCYCSLRYGGKGWRDSPFGHPIRPALYRIGRTDGLLRLLIFFEGVS
jgi:hypothetical protein